MKDTFKDVIDADEELAKLRTEVEFKMNHVNHQKRMKVQKKSKKSRKKRK